MSDVLSRLRYLSKGTTLRVDHGHRPTEGTFVEVATDALVIARGEVMERIPAAEITRVAKKVTWAWYGFGGGLVIGLVLGLLVGVKAVMLSFGFLGFQGTLIIAGIAALIVGLFGAALGAWIPRWKTIWPSA